MNTDPNKARIARNIEKMHAQGASSTEIESYIQGEGLKPVHDMHAAPIVQESPHKAGLLESLGASVTAAVPLAAKLGSAAGALVRRPGQSFGDAYSENMDINKEALEGARKDHKKLSYGTTVAATLPQFAIPGRAAVVSGGIGALTGLSEAEGGVGSHLGATALGGAAGGVLGWGAGKLFGMGAKKVLPALGGIGGGASTDGDLSDRALGAAGGAAVGYGAARGGAKLGGKAIDWVSAALRKASPMLTEAERGAGEYAKRLGSLRNLLEFNGGKGAIAADLEGVGSPIAQLTETVATYPGEEVGKLIGTIKGRAKFAPDQAEKAARKAIGSRFVPEQPVAREAQEEISRAARPLYDKLAGVEVDASELKALLEAEPHARGLVKHALDIERRRKKGGMDAVDLPELFEEGADGSIKFLRDTYPVEGIDIFKKAIRSYGQKQQNSTNTLTEDDGDILMHYLGKMTGAAKDEAPVYREALEGYGDIAEGKVQGLAERKRLEIRATGNSATARREKGQENFEDAAPNLHSLGSSKGIIEQLLETSLGKRLSGMNTRKANSSAAFLNRPVETEAERVEMARQIVAYLRKIEAQKHALEGASGAVSRGVGLGSGQLAGYATRGNERPKRH